MNLRTYFLKHYGGKIHGFWINSGQFLIVKLFILFILVHNDEFYVLLTKILGYFKRKRELARFATTFLV